MKYFKFLLLTLFLFSTVGSYAQELDRSTPPEPKPAPEIKFEKPYTFKLDNGLTVIVSENHELPRVSFQLSVDADPVKEGDAVGYVSAAGELLRNGTENRTKAEIDEAIDFIGADLSTYQNGIYAACLTRHSDDLLEIMSDVLLHPAYPESEIDKYKKKAVSALASSKTNASFIAGRVARKLRYKDHPYGEFETEKTIGNIQRDMLVGYYSTYYRPNISYLVIVGDITLEKAKEMAGKYFGGWQKAEVPTHNYDFPERTKGTRVALVNKEDAVQSYVTVTYPVDLQISSEDAIDANVMNNILGGGVFSGYLMQNLREDKGFTYGARSQLSSNPEVGYFSASAEVGTGVTDSSVNEFLYEMNRIRNERVESEHLDLVKNVMYGQFARSLESPRTKARFALNTQRYNLPADYYANYLKKVESVSAEDVKDAADKYILPEESIVLVVGNQKEVEEKLKRFAASGEVEIYDEYGNPVEEAKAIPSDMTAEKVIDKYIEALGGKEAIKKIETKVQTATVSMGPRSITVKVYQKYPNLMATEMEMQGTVIQKQVFNGKEAKVSAMGQTQVLSGERLEQFKFESQMFKFLRYEELGIQTELVSIEKVNGKQAYKVKITSPTGETKHDFFDTETGLKIRSVSKTQTPNGEVTQTEDYSDYKEVKGVMFPYTIQISGMQNMVMDLDSVEINKELEDSVFEL